MGSALTNERRAMRKLALIPVRTPAIAVYVAHGMAVAQGLAPGHAALKGLAAVVPPGRADAFGIVDWT